MKYWMWALVFSLACHKHKLNGVEETQGSLWMEGNPFEAQYDPFQLITDNSYNSQPLVIDTVLGVPEASGMVASTKYPGKAWVHNDSGNEPELFLLDLTTARICCTYRDTSLKNI